MRRVIAKAIPKDPIVRVIVVLGVVALIGVGIAVAVTAQPAPETSQRAGSTPQTPYQLGYIFMRDGLRDIDPASPDYSDELQILVDVCQSTGREMNASREYGRGAGTEVMRGCTDALAQN